MFLEKIKSEGIAHMSYMVGSKNEAFVIDPRRDIDIYLQIAQREGVNIVSIFETHKNEDYVVGSIPLGQVTGAKIYHGSEFDFKYGNSVREGDKFEIGNIELEILETPGHTYESISIVLKDKQFDSAAVGVFTGDALFIGDTGRTDFFPNKKGEVAGLLYDSIFNKLLKLGDQVIIYPAHGAGSVCGSNLASREFSTIGFERMHNPDLQKTDKADFMDYKENQHHYQPPYFRKMEEYNKYGPPLTGLALPRIIDADELSRASLGGTLVLDTRSPEAVAGCMIPGSLAIPLDMLPAFAGWFISYDQPISLVVEDIGDVDTAVRHLFRLGYDKVVSVLAGSLHEWETSGRSFETIAAVYIKELSQMIDQDENFTLLDVRSIEEFNSSHLPGAKNIYLGHLPDHIDEIDRKLPVVTFCGSGKRASIAASILKMNGFEDVRNCFGSIAACKKAGCTTV